MRRERLANARGRVAGVRVQRARTPVLERLDEPALFLRQRRVLPQLRLRVVPDLLPFRLALLSQLCQLRLLLLRTHERRGGGSRSVDGAFWEDCCS